jgi:hypothetical protein
LNARSSSDIGGGPASIIATASDLSWSASAERPRTTTPVDTILGIDRCRLAHVHPHEPPERVRGVHESLHRPPQRRERLTERRLLILDRHDDEVEIGGGGGAPERDASGKDHEIGVRIPLVRDRAGGIDGFGPLGRVHA